MGGISRAEALRLAKICLPQIDASLDASSLDEGAVSTKSLCRLWAGMGTILSVKAETNSSTHEFIVKHVVPPRRKSRSLGDRRKADSYLVEANFYENLAPRMIEAGLALPVPYHVEVDDGNDEVIICMSRLDGSPAYLDSRDAVNSVLDWLSTLHAATWGTAEEVDALVDEVGLQPVGSYWHLDTRPDEHSNMSRRGWEGRLRLAARAIDERLKRDAMQCCVHGDAKDANIMLDRDGSGGIAARMYDLQYCGRACPAVDIAYFLCVAVGDVDRIYIEYYHQKLVEKLRGRGRRDVPALNELEDSIDLALSDFQRFMCGWGQWGSDISASVLRVLQRLDGGKALGSEDAYCDAMLREYG